MKSWKLLLGAAAAALTFGSAAMAQETPAAAAPAPGATPAGAPASAPAAAPAPAYTYVFNLAYTSDYLFRGLSQTSGDGAPSGGVDVTFGQFYLGNWDSKVNFGPTAGDPGNETSVEYDLYGGFRPTLGPVALDVGFIRYGYVNAPNAAHYDYWEGKILASYATGPNTLGGAFYYSPEFFGKTGAAEYYEINDAYSGLIKNVTLSGAVGYQALDKAKAGIKGYTTWNVGATYAFNSHIGVDVRYWGTDKDATDFYTKTFAGDRVVGTLKVTFP
jgi:uncharacterized protein (TIGR02001 family)